MSNVTTEGQLYIGNVTTEGQLYIGNVTTKREFARQHSFLFEVSLTSKSTARLLARSTLLPARAITILGLACLCSSRTQFLARENVSCKIKQQQQQ